MSYKYRLEIVQQAFGSKFLLKTIFVFKISKSVHKSSIIFSLTVINFILIEIRRGEWQFLSINNNNLFNFHCFLKINKLVKEYNMNIIFAVTERQRELYEKITEQIRGSSYGILDADSKNVIKLVKGHYEVH